MGVFGIKFFLEQLSLRNKCSILIVALFPKGEHEQTTYVSNSTHTNTNAHTNTTTKTDKVLKPIST